MEPLKCWLSDWLRQLASNSSLPDQLHPRKSYDADLQHDNKKQALSSEEDEISKGITP